MSSIRNKILLEKVLRKLCSIPKFDVPGHIPTDKKNPKWKELKGTCNKSEIDILKLHFCEKKELLSGENNI